MKGEGGGGWGGGGAAAGGGGGSSQRRKKCVFKRLVQLSGVQENIRKYTIFYVFNKFAHVTYIAE